MDKFKSQKKDDTAIMYFTQALKNLAKIILPKQQCLEWKLEKNLD